MCVVSNIGDSYRDRDGWPWRPVMPQYPYIPADPTIPDQSKKDFQEEIARILKKQVDGTEIDDLKKRIEALEEMLKAGKKLDAETGQPDCELDEKVELLKRLAKELGVEIQFPA